MMFIQPRQKERVETYTDIFSSAGDISVAAPSRAILTDIIVSLQPLESPPTLRILTEEGTTASLKGNFLITTHLMDYIDAGIIELRYQSSRVPSFVISGTEVIAEVGFPQIEISYVESTERVVRRTTLEAFEKRFAEGVPVTFRTPGLSDVLSSLEEEFGNDLRDDVETGLIEASNSKTSTLTLDPVGVVLMAAALHGISFYEISRWGERVTFASRAKFSRIKQSLEDADCLDFEKIPTDIGRPRHRLLPGEAVNEETPIESIISITEERVAN